MFVVCAVLQSLSFFSLLFILSTCSLAIYTNRLYPTLNLSCSSYRRFHLRKLIRQTATARQHHPWHTHTNGIKWKLICELLSISWKSNYFHSDLSSLVHFHFTQLTLHHSCFFFRFATTFRHKTCFILQSMSVYLIMSSTLYTFNSQTNEIITLA